MRTENNSFFSYFEINKCSYKTFMLCSKVSNARLLNGDLRSSKRSESQQSRITLTQRVIS